MTTRKAIGIVGARGHTGTELIRLVAAHPQLELAFVSSRELDGQPVADHVDAFHGPLRYQSLDPAAVAARGADVVVLALPNGKAAPFVEAIDATRPDTLVVDLSADYRFDPGWYYGLPEITRGRYAGQKRISNPGCYATAMQLAIWPMLDQLAGPPQCFGVSGYSGAGTTFSDKNNIELLRDNLMPYSLADHLHEREVSAQLGVPVEFMPHVAPHFRGITLTANLWLREPVTVEFADGEYALARPVVFEPEDSGTAESPVAFAAAKGAEPVFFGGRRLPPSAAGRMRGNNGPDPRPGATTAAAAGSFSRGCCARPAPRPRASRRWPGPARR